MKHGKGINFKIKDDKENLHFHEGDYVNNTEHGKIKYVDKSTEIPYYSEMDFVRGQPNGLHARYNDQGIGSVTFGFEVNWIKNGIHLERKF